jgi:hypothetical protein
MELKIKNSQIKEQIIQLMINEMKDNNKGKENYADRVSLDSIKIILNKFIEFNE